MAARFTATRSPDDIDQLLYLKNAQGLYRGFKTRYISQNLTKMEGYLMTCRKCKGIIRDASSYEGETVCKLCNTNQLNPKRVQKVRNSVAELKIKCPLLRDCGWSGKLLEGEKHLKECGSFLITCPLGCEDVMKRCEMNDHLKTYCLFREINCEFCELSITCKNLTEHVSTCPAYSVVCECRRIMRRDKVKEHIDKDCRLTELECPYAKYGCKVGKIPRKELVAHKEDFYIEHQDMIEQENCLLTKQVKILVEKYDLLEGKKKKENSQLVQKHELMERNMKTLEGTIETKHDQLVRKHDRLEGKVVTKHDRLLQEHAQLRQENNQLRQRLNIMGLFTLNLAQEIRLSKKLIGTAIDLDLSLDTVTSGEFNNGEYRFVYEITTSSVHVRTISLRRLPTSTYSDRNVICITDCILYLEPTAQTLPFSLHTKLHSKIETGVNVPIILLRNNLISNYQQHNGIVRMEICFDYDYITYKGYFTIF